MMNRMILDGLAWGEVRKEAEFQKQRKPIACAISSTKNLVLDLTENQGNVFSPCLRVSLYRINLF